MSCICALVHGSEIGPRPVFMVCFQSCKWYIFDRYKGHFYNFFKAPLMVCHRYYHHHHHHNYHHRHYQYLYRLNKNISFQPPVNVVTNNCFGISSIFAHNSASMKVGQIMNHDAVIKWKHFPRSWPFVRGIHRSPVVLLTKASDTELCCFLWSACEQAVDQTTETPVIWDAIALIMKLFICVSICWCCTFAFTYFSQCLQNCCNDLCWCRVSFVIRE